MHRNSLLGNAGRRRLDRCRHLDLGQRRGSSVLLIAAPGPQASLAAPDDSRSAGSVRDRVGWSMPVMFAPE